MGFDFSAVEGEDGLRLHGVDVVVALSAMSHAGLLDLDARPPMQPEVISDRYGLEDHEIEDWPFLDSTEEERAAFGWPGPDPQRVPACKLWNNEIWLISPAECMVLADGADEILSGKRPRFLSHRVHSQLIARGYVDDKLPAEVERLLAAFGEFCRECAGRGGFWAY